MHFYPLSFGIFLLLLCATGLSFPVQVTLHSTSNVKSFASEVASGDDPGTLLLNLAARLDRGMPDGWQTLTNAPETTGSTDAQSINTQDLGQVLEGWGLPLNIRGQAHQDVQSLIDLHASEAIFVSQTFAYDTPGCEGGELPVCLQSLMVVVRRQPNSNGMDAVKIWHVWIESYANAIQQFNHGGYCHSCSIFFECCHDTEEPRDFHFWETDIIQAVLSTSQAAWCQDHLPTEPTVSLPTEPTVSLPTEPTVSSFDPHDPIHQTVSTLSLAQDPSVLELLRRFINNEAENEDVFRSYDDALLSTLQGSMHSAQKQTKSFSLSLKMQDLSIVTNLVRPCLREAGINMSVEQLWEQAQGSSLNRPFSLECQQIQQKRIIDGEPVGTCNKSATVHMDMLHSWVLLYPRKESIDCIFMETSAYASRSECERYPSNPEIPECQWLTVRFSFLIPLSNLALRLPGSPQPDRPDMEDPDLPPQGSIVRWSVPQQEGRFSPVKYLTRWSAYPREVNEVAMNIARFLSASVFLKSPVPRSRVMQNLVDDSSPSTPVPQMMDPATLLALGDALGAIADGWDKASNILFGSSSEKVTRQICLGFEKYAHSVRVIKAVGIPQEQFSEHVEILLRLGQVQVKEVEELQELIGLIVASEDFTWKGLTVQYTSSNGSFHSWACFYKHTDPETNKSTILFGTLQADFNIAQDILVVERKEVGPLGTGREQTVEFRGVPHTITPNDTALLNKYFEVVAYRELAPLLGKKKPEYPTIPPCPN
ncbi:MAG: hypothetical protein J3R72DRAFT_481081 [Linnemannia gamsii]|nr:MAG: hypothetical protein J3R72DRAFT_481081 [Linnemannia gamsii]